MYLPRKRCFVFNLLAFSAFWIRVIYKVKRNVKKNNKKQPLRPLFRMNSHLRTRLIQPLPLRVARKNSNRKTAPLGCRQIMWQGRNIYLFDTFSVTDWKPTTRLVLFSHRQLMSLKRTQTPFDSSSPAVYFSLSPWVSFFSFLFFFLWTANIRNTIAWRYSVARWTLLCHLPPLKIFTCVFIVFVFNYVFIADICRHFVSGKIANPCS